MTSTQIGSYVNVGVRPEISEVSTIATEISKCYLEGCYDDYIFFYVHLYKIIDYILNINY